MDSPHCCRDRFVLATLTGLALTIGISAVGIVTYPTPATTAAINRATAHRAQATADEATRAAVIAAQPDYVRKELGK